MTTQRIDKPRPTTVRIVAWISVGFAVLAVLLQVFYAVVLAPALPRSFAIAVTGRYQSGGFDATPEGLAVFGFVFVIAGLIAAIVAVVLSRSGASAAYAFGVIVSLFVPAWVGFLLGSVFATLSSPEGASGVSDASIYAGVGVVVGFLALYFAPRLSGAKVAE